MNWEHVKVAPQSAHSDSVRSQCPTALAGHLMEMVDGSIYIYGGRRPVGEDQLKLETVDAIWMGKVRDGAAQPTAAQPGLSIEWRSLYRSDASHLSHLDGRSLTVSLSRIVNKKLLLLGSETRDGLISLEPVRFLDLAAISESMPLSQIIQKYLPAELREIDKWLNLTTKGLDIKVGEDLEKLLKVMDMLYSVKLKTDEMDLMVDVQNEAIAFLKSQGLNVDREEKLLNSVSNS